MPYLPRRTVIDEYVSKHIAGEFVIPGSNIRGDQVPPDLLMAAPTAPQLNVCVRAGNGDGIIIPAHVVEKWSTSAQFSGVFQDLWAQFLEEFPQQEEIATSPGKRPLPEGEEAKASPAKYPRLEAGALDLQDCGKVKDPVMVTTVMTNFGKAGEGKVTLQARHGGIYIFNEAQAAIKVPAGMIIMGFGPGSFTHKPRNPDGTKGEVDEERLVLFDLPDCAAMVLQNNKPGSIGSMVLSLRETKPDIMVNYHSIQEGINPQDPKQFRLIRSHDVYYHPKGVAAAEPAAPEAAKSQGAFAGLLPLSKVRGLKLAAVVWSVKLTTKGIMPVKPHVCATADFEVPAGKAVKL